MEPAESSRGTKRRLAAGDEDDDGRERKPRFPKGKKAKHRDPAADGGGAVSFDIDSVMNPELAAERRARQRHQREKDDKQDSTAEVKVFEVRYDDAVNFVEDGIRIEPFNLEQEREEGYFDENGNFVEYARGNELKDAWLDNVEVDPTLAAKLQDKGKEKEEDFQDLSSDDIGKIKRRIANMLEPGETVLQALKRLKNTSTDERGKMTEGTKRIFDELTEAAMKLMDNAGYERLACARLGLPEVEDTVAATAEDNQTTSSIMEMEHGPSASDTLITTTSFNDDDSNFDMFGDDDIPDGTSSSNAKTVDASGTSGTEEADNGSVSSDYIYDPPSGYYYSSSTGYYYDPNTGYYCSSSTGTWYSYDEQTARYKEVQDVQAGTNNEELVYAVKE